MRHWIFINMLALTLSATAVSWSERGSLSAQVKRSQSEGDPQTDEFIKRLFDEKFGDILGGIMWTLIHDYKDRKHLEKVLNTMQGYFEALEKYEQGDASSLRQRGGIKGFKDQLAAWLADDDQAIRAYAATMLGVSGDIAYAPQVAKLLTRKKYDPDDLIYDRGRAATALGMLQAKEYVKDLIALLSSKNDYDRAGAAMGLGWMGSKDHAKAVARLLTDEEETVREAAKQALKMMGAGEPLKEKK